MWNWWFDNNKWANVGWDRAIYVLFFLLLLIPYLFYSFLVLFSFISFSLYNIL